MRKNKIKEILANGETALSGWLHIPNTWTAELMANAGWDCLTVDMQHGLHSLETAMQIMQAISTTNTVPFARSLWNEPSGIMRLLDSGAYGIICPMVNTRAECEAFVGACRYPPVGYRSLGPTRARVYAGADYGEHANDEILTLAMIETQESVQNIDEINAVAGLDGIFVGSGDLKLAYTGKATHAGQSEAFEAAIEKVLASCQKHGIIAGIWCATLEDAKKRKEQGFRFIALKSDSMMFGEYINKTVSEIRQL
ncbi:MAG: 2,4-dihydroxyhept-2-ene-1,7-dioic acid aldolase [Runella slithyformis]|nr:MAG: 2,4-dihydroxyhept-2-ene-1,7-dioic acid aldolase [Runella slithyformis]TAF27419.1 MAG: 2,4-dihydroxyhept-2-ene-1,7-dioic acid aldolase [Runella slithyformis]TAF45983.1 MAG: 2,4-dihydroxyhept-2-ene-1,7-dioic acid aldolase [Runella slithyformis]TAG39990.1 MAG: 2,4-dihydroxyhept-2-ene-1,7-dioic acid aldolase [Cytophagia bacterium]TAG75207.1 MAG: 2,4-dihydroxyhept-2-ene-1,7-dioic acid aldolase [Runella slithyformis]